MAYYVVCYVVWYLYECLTGGDKMTGDYTAAINADD